MIKRIRSIYQTGLFSSFHSGNQLEFKKMTLIFGFNAYGKSTLCDIFKSLAHNDSTYIQKRKTIPTSTERQKITLSIDDANPPQEKNLDYKNNRWENNNIAKYIEVFDTSFIYDNVFTGMSIERRNKEKLTDFILGEESVQLAKEIESGRKLSAEKKRELKKSIPDYVQGKSDREIRDFIKLKVEKDLPSIMNELFEKQTRKKELDQNIKNASNIIQMKEPIPLRSPDYSQDILNIKNICDLLQRTFEALKDEALADLKNHISSILNNSIEAENWIKRGVELITDQLVCPFCGQDLKPVEKLISTYQNYFDKEYISLLNEIENCPNRINKIKLVFSGSKELGDAIIILKDYVKFFNDDLYKDRMFKLESYRIILERIEKDMEKEVESIKNQLLVDIENKKRAPNTRIENINTELLENSIKNYLYNLNSSFGLIEDLRIYIRGFKDKYKIGTSVIAESERLLQEINVLEKHKARIEQNSKCDEYRTLLNEIKKIDDKNKELDALLEATQTDYLDKYFDLINKLFRKLGSDDYTIERNNENKGYKKVYGLTIKYKNIPIKDIDLPYVFSESDRRALALAIFWTKILVKSKEGKEKTIIILDDPVTSFDDNRITNTIDIIRKTLEKVHQIIICTHYSNFLKRYKEITRSSNCCYLQISRDVNTNCLALLNIDDFSLSDYQKQFFRIYSFVNNKTNDDVRNILRPFLEEHLRIVFYKQIAENSLGDVNLYDLIEGLYEKNVFNSQTKETLHRFREILNPDSHIFTNNNIEDVRSFAHSLLDAAYSIKLDLDEVV